MPKDTGTGASTKRREDVRFLTGKGVCTDDLSLFGQVQRQAAWHGLSTWIEACGIAPSHLVGVLGARVGNSHGQGHETVLPQIVAEKLGVDASSVEIVHGDAAKILFGVNALHRGGHTQVSHIDMSVSPNRVWQAINA